MVLCIFQCVLSIIAFFFVIAKAKYGDLVADCYNINYGQAKVLAYLICIVTGISQLVITILIIQLLLLHSWLQKYNLTTYDYALYTRERELNPNLKLTIEDVRKYYVSKIILKKESINDTSIKNTPRLSQEIISKKSKERNRINNPTCCEFMYE